MKTLKLEGRIKYDDKHDSYFIQTLDKKVFTLHTINKKVCELASGKIVAFTANKANEVLEMEFI